MADTSVLHPEQDHDGGDDLPSYEQLAAQKGPNSRFGRWKGWVEKRAAERYAHLTPEERTRRRERGWGDGVEVDPEEDPFNDSSMQTTSQLTELSAPAPPSYVLPTPEPAPTLSYGQPLSPSTLKLHTFGSRFLAHTTAPIRTLLPLLGDRLLLIGHDDGLSVFDMFPSGDPRSFDLADVEVKEIWKGEGVYQLEVLEFEDSRGSTPQGVVLALVGTDVDSPRGKDQDHVRMLRMYNLASLISLARWTVSQKDTRPLDLQQPSNWTPQQITPKKHRHHSSITKGFKSLIIESPVPAQATEPRLSYQNMMPPSVPPKDSCMQRTSSDKSADSAWDMVDDLPLRWATDYVPFASVGSRLHNCPINFFELKRDEYREYGGHTILAVATKSNVLLYETPKGERAFRFVKEFYTPLQARGIVFVEQRVQDNSVTRTTSQTGLVSPRNHDLEPRRRSMNLSNGSARSPSSSNFEYDPQLSMFVIFEKKAGLIRLADSAVGEVELFGESHSSGTLPRLSRTSLDNVGYTKETKAPWLRPSEVALPGLSNYSSERLCFITRGKLTYIFPSPLPVPISSYTPTQTLTWLSPPQDVTPRVCSPPDGAPFLQVVGLGEFGVEVQEMSLNFSSKGKGKGRADAPIRTQADVGGDAGFLCRGGMWHKPHSYLMRTDSIMSVDSLSGPANTGMKAEQGLYAWCRKGIEDWRIFWLGGMDRDSSDAMDSNL